jgi:hypothetical protein
MIPGKTTRLSESTVVAADTIKAETDVVVATGAVGINTIVPAGLLGGQQCQALVLITPAAVILGTTGNIAVGITTAINRPVHLTFVRSLGKWFINSGV